jgi:hypothetical protein
MLPGLFLPLLAVAALERPPRSLVPSLIVGVAALNLPHTEPKGYLTFDDEYYAPASIASRGIHAAALEDYEPRSVTDPPPYTTVRVAGVEAPVEILSENVLSTRQELNVRTQTGTAAEAATFHYPGWRVLVDGVPADAEIVPGRGTIGFALPSGTHRIVIELEPTPVRRATVWLSLLALVVAGFSTLLGDRRPRGH